MNKRLKRIGLIFTVAALGIVTGVSVFASSPKEVADVEAVITGNDVRIAVVRPSWWENNGAYQVMRIAADAADLTNGVKANITHIGIESYASDTYYTSGGGFTEYATDGVVYYDVPIASLTGKYVDLARLSSSDIETASYWNSTGPELWDNNLLHKVWRIWDNGGGIHRPAPEGENEAESRNVSNGVINSLLYGYLTCSPSVLNGYGAFSDLDTSFNLTGRTYLETDTVLDYVDAEGNPDYSVGRGDGWTVNTGDKVEMMGNLFIASQEAQSIGYFENKSYLPLIIGIALVGITGIAGLYILKKKRA